MLKLIAGLCITGVVVLILLLMALLSDQPVVASNVTLSHQHILQVRQVVKNHLDELPQDQKNAAIQFNQQELNVVVNYLLQRASIGSANIATAEQKLVADATFPLSELSRYLNIRMELHALAGKPSVEQFVIGQLKLPGFLGQWLTFWSLQQFLGLDLRQQIQSIQIQDNLLRLVYRRDQKLVQRIKHKMFDLGEPETLQAYVDKLQVLQQQTVGKQRQLTPLLQALFAYAQERSQSNDPAQENAALLTMLGLWAGRQNLSDYVVGLEREPRKFNLKLNRRIDAARHFLLSAALAVRGDHRLAQAIGLSKELADADTQSGFSFADLAANQAGIAFGLLATQSTEQARYLQDFMIGDRVDTDMMPLVRDLPENMDRKTFQQRFGGVDKPAYKEMMAEIQRRVNACAIYQRQ